MKTKTLRVFDPYSPELGIFNVKVKGDKIREIELPKKLTTIQMDTACLNCPKVMLCASGRTDNFGLESCLKLKKPLEATA